LLHCTTRGLRFFIRDGCNPLLTIHKRPQYKLKFHYGLAGFAAF
jgi:hypothetical protein